MARRLKRDKKWGLMKYFFFFYVFAIVFVFVWLNTAVTNIEYEIGQLEKQKTGLIRDGKLLTAEKERFYAIAKVEDTAVKQLGMRLPEREKIFFVKKTSEAAPYKVSMKSTSALPDGRQVYTKYNSQKLKR